MRRAIGIVFESPSLDDLDGAGELLVVLRLLGLALRMKDARPLQMLPRRHQEGPRRFVDHRHLPFANHFIAMLHASGAASTLQRGGIPHTRHSCECASVPPDPVFPFSL
jgi:hypothetical protein